MNRKILGLFLCLIICENKAFGAGQKTKELPFYFPQGVVESDDPIKQVVENKRYFKAAEKHFQSDPNHTSALTNSGDSIIVETDLESTSSALNRDQPTKMKLVLDNYVRVDGKIRVTYLDDQLFITEHQLKVVADDLEETAKQARDYNCQFWQPITKLAAETRSAKLGVPENELEKLLDVTIPGYKDGITVRELNGLPRPTRCSDFVPRELHLGVNPEIPGGILGVAWLNTGVVYYNPQARVRDYLMKKPMVLQHEMVHTNINLQELLQAQGFDPELMASSQEMLYPENEIDLPAHHYSMVLRDLAWIYFGFNYEQALKESVRWDFAGNLWVDEQKMRENSEKWRKIKAELMPFLQNAVIPEFYSDPTWWSAMNQKLQDKNSVFHILMAAHYNATILGGEKETSKWLETHEGEIKEMAEKAWSLSGTPLNNNANSQNLKFPTLLLGQYQSLFTEEEQKKIEFYLQEHPELTDELPKMKISEIVKFFLQFKTKPPTRKEALP